MTEATVIKCCAHVGCI